MVSPREEMDEVEKLIWMVKRSQTFDTPVVYGISNGQIIYNYFYL